MAFFLIADEEDTLTGLRLAGIQGVMAEGRAACLREIKTAAADERIAVLLITKSLAALCREEIAQLKQEANRPLVVEIPSISHLPPDPPPKDEEDAPWTPSSIN